MRGWAARASSMSAQSSSSSTRRDVRRSSPRSSPGSAATAASHRRDAQHAARSRSPSLTPASEHSGPRAGRGTGPPNCGPGHPALFCSLLHMRLRSLLAIPRLRLEVVTGEDDLDRAIRWVVTTDLLDPGRYLRGRELVLTGLVWRTRPADSETFVRALAEAGVSGLAAWDLALGAIPADLVEACRRHRLPLFKVPEDVAFATVTEEVVRQLSADRAADLTAVLDRHRRLVEGTGLDAVLDLVGHCHVLAPTGRVVAGPPPHDPGALAEAFLTAPRLPHHVPALGMSVFPVAGGAVPRVADWFIASEGDFGDWPPERRDLTTELAALVAIERARLDDSARSPRDLVAVAAAGGGDLRPEDVRAVLAEALPRPRAVGLLDDEVVALVPAGGEDVAAEARAALGLLAPGLPHGGIAAGVSDVATAPGLRA